MTIFYMVRHGQIDRDHVVRGGNPADPPLSTQGRMEAEQVVAFLRPHPILRVYASDLRRAQETAAPLAAALNLLLRVDRRLRERVNFGEVPGQSREEFAALWEQGSRERDFVPPVGDSSRAAGQRVEAFMAEVHGELLAAGVTNGEVVAVAHGGLIADFLLNIATPEQLAAISPEFAERPYAGDVMRNGSITVVEYTVDDVQRYHVRSIALVGHLQPTAGR